MRLRGYEYVTPPGLCHYHFANQKMEKKSVVIVRERCNFCEFFRIVEACVDCGSSIADANKNAGHRTCQGCGVRDLSSINRLVIGKVRDE